MYCLHESGLHFERYLRKSNGFYHMNTRALFRITQLFAVLFFGINLPLVTIGNLTDYNSILFFC